MSGPWARSAVLAEATFNCRAPSNTVADTTPPVIKGVGSDTTVNSSAIPTAVVTATDNAPCFDGIVTKTETRQEGDCSATGDGTFLFKVTRTYTAKDHSGNTATASQTLTVMDDEPPVLSGVPNNTTAPVEAVPIIKKASATDNDQCFDSSKKVTPLEVRMGRQGCTARGNAAYLYKLVRTYTAADRSGNTATAVQTVTVVDNQPPVLVGVPKNVTVAPGAVPHAVSVTATDNDAECFNSSQQIVPTEVRLGRQDCTSTGTTGAPYLYQLVRTYSVADLSSNTATAVQTVTVLDDEPPVFQGVPVDAAAQCGAVLPPAAALQATDNDVECFNSSKKIRPTEQKVPGACSGNYSIVRTWSVADPAGNKATANQTIQVSVHLQ